MTPVLNAPAPAFTLPDQDGKIHSLSDYTGQWVLLYFYPKDNTPGCTKQACGLRDSIKDYAAHHCVVLGISTDSVQSHKKFAEKYGLPFTLLADEQKTVVQLYDVWKEKTFMGKAYMGTMRTSFLINPQGELVRMYPDVSPEEHAAQVLADLAALTA